MASPTEFRFCYSTNNYDETIAFYKELLRWETFRSWDRGQMQRGTIFRSPSGTGLIEIEEGPDHPDLQGSLYVEVDDVDAWHARIVQAGVEVARPLADTSFGHRSFMFMDPNRLLIGLFKYAPS
jgi:predicted enzyme related to lactoylglutathione lyase